MSASTDHQTISALGCVYCTTAPAGCRFNSAPVCDGCLAKMLGGGWWQLPSALWTSLELGLTTLDGVA